MYILFLHTKEMWKKNVIITKRAWVLGQHLKACDANHIEHKQGGFTVDHFETEYFVTVLYCKKKQ